MKAIIVDDEQSARDVLSQTLNRVAPEINIVGEADSVQSAIEVINENQPDIIYLDIQMPYQNGFELLDQIEQNKYVVIFTTAYDQYSIRAIKYSAFDYLIKPISPTELQESIQRLKESKHGLRYNAMQAEMLRSVLSEQQKPTKILIPSSKGIDVVPKSEIIRLEGDRNYSWIMLSDGRKIHSSRTLKEFEEMLDDENFMRVYQSHIVNLDFIVSYIRGKGGQLKLRDGSLIEVSRDKKKALLAKLGV